VEFSPAGIQEKATNTGQLADELRSIRQEWMGATAGSAAVLGMNGLISAFESMREAWVGEFNLYVDVVSGLDLRLGSSAGSYDITETANTAAVQPAGR
jgi:hypothetical protein